MSLRFYNTASRAIEKFKSQSEDSVSLYTCGPTVYDELTIGNWSAYIYWDILVRTLIHEGYTVNRVMNITDVGHLVSDEDTGEDKLEKGAARDGKTAWDVAEIYLQSFLTGMESLGLLRPTHIIRATDEIKSQLQLAVDLKYRGHTYQIDDGIYFDTTTFAQYANFAGLDLSKQTTSGRVTDLPQKRNPSDFAVWKFSPFGDDTVKNRDMQWPTPRELLDTPPHDQNEVMGFPGWHLECSAIALKYLGDTLDIHTGGIDHIPVHHTNEIAQSESVTGRQFSKLWLHNNHLKVNGTKISKSLGNGYTLSDIYQRGYTADDIRMFVLQSHYRTEGNFSFNDLASAHNRLQRWQDVACLRWQINDTLTSDATKRSKDETVLLLHVTSAIHEKLSNDLHTPSALAVVDATFDRVVIHARHHIDHDSFMTTLEAVDEQLGFSLLQATPDINDEIKQLILERTRAREAKNYIRSDELRDELMSRSIRVRDDVHGTVWSYC